MKKRYHFLGYSIVWGIAILFLMAMFYQNYGNARVINYTGLIRGGTQQLVKQELMGVENEALMENLDSILYELRTGEGEHNIRPCTDPAYQEKIQELDQLWTNIQQEIQNVQQGNNTQELYDLSEEYFIVADEAVSKVEEYSEYIMHTFTIILILYLLISISCILIWSIKKEKQMQKIYYTDDLTDAYNKTAFVVRCKHILEVSKDALGLLYFDIDGFKRINDDFGYQAGDQLLKEIADFMRFELHDEFECFARTSADNYIVLFKREQRTIADFDERLLMYLHRHLEYVNPISLSYGVYELPQDDDEEVAAMMDKAMIAHKVCKTRNDTHILYYDNALMDQIAFENSITAKMQQALDYEEFQMYLQPKFDIKKENIISAEALVRWISPTLGFLPPDSFIPLFEKNGFIAKLDFYMIEQVCRFLQKSLMETSIATYPISVNVSRVTLLEEKFIEKFINVVKKYNIPASYIEVELTESAFNGLNQQAMKILQQLQDHGFLVSMDDFGSGYSSLNLLRSMPINILKLDREFINEQQHTKEAQGIVSCIVEMAHLMNLQVICEGIETKEQLTFLQQIGCDFGQGYYYAKPMPVQEFQKLYLKQKTCS